jgi:hypothetical protein
MQRERYFLPSTGGLWRSSFGRGKQSDLKGNKWKRTTIFAAPKRVLELAEQAIEIEKESAHE